MIVRRIALKLEKREQFRCPKYSLRPGSDADLFMSRT